MSNKFDLNLTTTLSSQYVHVYDRKIQCVCERESEIVCVYVCDKCCVCVRASERERDGQANRHTYRQTHSQKDMTYIQTNKQIDIRTDRDTVKKT